MILCLRFFIKTYWNYKRLKFLLHKFKFATNFKLYFMKGKCDIKSYKTRILELFGVTGET